MNKKGRVILISSLFIFLMFYFLLFQKSCQPQGEGSLLVTGTGQDLYHVFDQKSGDKFDFTSTGNSMTLLAGKYVLKLHGSSLEIKIKPDQETTVHTGILMVAGKGINLYEVWDEANQTKLDFIETGKGMDFFPGNYWIKLNNIGQKIIIQEQDSTIIQSGQVVVHGNTKELYEVYSADGKQKLNFTFLENPIELLPGDYVVKWEEHSKKISIKPSELTEIN